MTSDLLPKLGVLGLGLVFAASAHFAFLSESLTLVIFCRNLSAFIGVNYPRPEEEMKINITLERRYTL